MPAEPTTPSDSRYAETMVNQGQEFAKEQQDIALAAVILQSGVVNERELSSALSTWTMHGSVLLSEHLSTLGLLDAADIERLTQEASRQLAESDSISGSGNGAASKSVLLNTLDAFDASGTVARLMGIRAVAGAGAIDATGVRRAAVNYRLVRKLGQGGLGRVWLAFDESIKRYVAVKEITVKDNAAVLERFRREAEITGRLEHPGIVPVYQLGDDSQTGEAFYAMRFLGKTTLHDSIMEYHERRNEGDDDPMLIRRLLGDFVNICQAIGHAHSRKVIHRDLKPENIAIDSFGQVIVIDWGIAKVIDDLNTTDTAAANLSAGGDQSTMQGQVLGTPLYMAPEQAAGRIDELDERTDIYGLGAILFAILTGYAPHERTREASSATSQRQMLSAIAGRPSPDAREANSSVDPALAAICSKAMARRQYARYQSASELANDVQRWMAREPVSAYREKPSQRAARWIQQHRIWSQVIAAVVIVGIVSLVTLAIASRQSHLAARQVLFDEMRAYEREVEVQIEATAEELAKDGRFMSTLPPIQGIIDARAGAEESEGEEIWRGRLETIYEGLLRANPDYLAISYTAVSAVGEEAEHGIDVVRVERNISDAAYVRRVPASRLGPYADAQLVANTASLPSGEILLTIRQQAPSASAASSANSTRQSVRLVASTPVYDDTTGELFGIVAVEMNLLAHLIDVVESLEQHNATIYITDGQGKIWITDEPLEGVDVRNSQRNVADHIPDAADFFTNDQQQLHLDRSQGWIASRVSLDPANPRTSVGILLQLYAQ